MFNPLTKSKTLRPGRPAWGIDAAANDNRRSASPRSDRPRLVCRWSLPEAGGRPVCRWEVEGADDADPRLRDASGQQPGPLHKTVLQLSYQRRRERRWSRAACAAVAPCCDSRTSRGVARASLDDAI